MATLTWLPWKCISCSNQSKGCQQSTRSYSTQSPTKFSFAGNFSMVMCQRPWKLGFKNLWKWKRWLPWPTDRTKGTQGKGKQKSLGRATKILSLGLWEKVANAITTMQSSLLCLYILAMISSILFTHVDPPTWQPLCLPLFHSSAAQWTEQAPLAGNKLLNHTTF